MLLKILHCIPYFRDHQACKPKDLSLDSLQYKAAAWMSRSGMSDACEFKQAEEETAEKWRLTRRSSLISFSHPEVPHPSFRLPILIFACCKHCWQMWHAQLQGAKSQPFDFWHIAILPFNQDRSLLDSNLLMKDVSRDLLRSELSRYDWSCWHNSMQEIAEIGHAFCP